MVFDGAGGALRSGGKGRDVRLLSVSGYTLNRKCTTSPSRMT